MKAPPNETRTAVKAMKPSVPLWRLMEIAGRKVLVLGAARSGIASARFLAQRGATVALNDRKPLDEWSAEALGLKTEGVGLVAGDAPSWLLDQIDLVVISPGVPSKSIPVRYAERRGVEVIGEVELASRFLRGRMVAITGTNGKTTTTSLIGQMLKDAGMNVQVGGNIGTALISMIDSSHDDGWNVVEVSSFQLETIVDFHPTVAKSHGPLRIGHGLRRCEATDICQSGAGRRGDPERG